MVKKLFLASGSPRRIQFLQDIKALFEIVIPEIDEKSGTTEGAMPYVKRISKEKVEFVQDIIISKNISNYVILGADTVVVLENQILGKPKDKDDAFNMLKKLRNNKHFVITGFCISDKERRVVDGVTSCVEFGYYSDREIENYLMLGEYKDKAGAYAIQGFASAFIKRVEGSYTNIIGLPLYEVICELKKFGVLNNIYG